MITVGMNYQVHQGKESPFEQKFALVLEAMQGIDGHVATQLYRDVARNTSYLVISEWNNREAFDNFVSSETFRKITAWGKANILATRPTHNVYGEEASGQPGR